MGNNELLLAISDMMDQKLDAINVRMDTMENKLETKIDAAESKLSADINALDAKIDAVESKLSADIHALDAKINDVDKRLSTDIKKINLSLENIVLPRLNHIEQCYLDTSERYIIETGRINGLTTDVQVLKSVVQEHGERLKKIS